MTMRNWLAAHLLRIKTGDSDRWSSTIPEPQPQPDFEAAHAYVTARVKEHVAVGSLDEAHGAILDREIAAIADGWRQDAHRYYLRHERELALANNEGVQRLTNLGRDLEAFTDECRRHQEFYDARWSELTEPERTYLQEHPIAPTPKISPLPGLAAHPLLILPSQRTYPPFDDRPPHGSAELFGPTEQIKLDGWRNTNHLEVDRRTL